MTMTEQDAARLQGIRADVEDGCFEEDVGFLLLLLDERPHDAEFVTRATHDAVVAERDRLDALYKEEYAALDRVWKALGIKTYQQAKGREISECVANLAAALASSEARLCELLQELQAYRDAAKYDVKMSGILPMGWDRSQLERARKLTQAAAMREKP